MLNIFRPDARSLHTLCAWNGPKDDLPSTLVLFGGQLTSRITIPSLPSVEPTSSPDGIKHGPSTGTTEGSTEGSIKGSVKGSVRGEAHRHHGKGGGNYYHMLDDDFTWSWQDNTVHAQSNDIWVYIPSRDVWQLVSTGGCHRGDSGELIKPKVDLTALFVVGTLVSAGIGGIVCYQLLRKYRTDEYDRIPD